MAMNLNVAFDLGHVCDGLTDLLDGALIVGYSDEAIASIRSFRDSIRNMYEQGLKDGRNDKKVK